MSEYINNGQERENALKRLLLDLHTGLDVAEFQIPMTGRLVYIRYVALAMPRRHIAERWR